MLAAVTGGGGFIGSRLVKKLHDSGVIVHTLLGPDDQNIIPPPEGVKFVFGDVNNTALIKSLICEANVVYHLAGPRSVAESFTEMPKYTHAHVGGTATVIDACMCSDVSRIVYVSSAEVYGKLNENPVNEDSRIEPTSPYGIAKAAAEQLVRIGSNSEKFESVIVRPFVVYGPGMPNDTLIGSLINKALNSDSIEVNDLRPIRDYCFVDDVVEALIKAGEVEIPERSRTYNVGSGVGVSVAQVVKNVIELTGRKDSVRESAQSDRPRDADILKLICDPGRAKQELNWETTTELNNGLNKIIKSKSN